ncbi:hypothetical protein scyTo_0009456 [Scyliorhinus torazame]|uniref:Uncharacterized protein n=1 Tax=Scyliorhinus torazame TaxID=75743 RepID=A0A401NMD8_SCYTO|nr:hypothetical protein [Scyliorhinus torazame]
MHPFPCSSLFHCFGNGGENVPPDQPGCKCRASGEQWECACIQPETIRVQPGVKPTEFDIPNITSNDISIGTNGDKHESLEPGSRNGETEPEQLQLQAIRPTQTMQHSHEEELSTLPDMPAAVNGPLSGAVQSILIINLCSELLQ